MNVLYLTEEPITFSGTMVRGGQIHVRNVVEGLRERGHDVRILDWNDTSERPYQHSLSPMMRYGVDPSRTAFRSVSVGQATDADIVVSKTRKTYLPGLFAARILSVPHVVHIGSSPESTSKGIARKFDTLSIQSRIRAPHDGYLVVCEALRNELLEVGIEPDLIYDVKNAVDTERFNPEQTPISLDPNHQERIMAFSDNRSLLGFVGGLYPYKGLDDLADALSRVDARYGVVIAGDGPERERLKRRFGEDGLFLGPIPYEQVPALYHEFDVLVLPSYTEGLPRVVLEAQATGTPVIATRVGGIPEVIQDGVTGLLYNPRDSTGLARQIDRLDDAHERERLGQQSRSAVETNFSWSVLYERYEQYLENVIDRHGA